ncbi:MAG: hypothetical protein HYS83_00135 [Candidatus Blackburnbacteria bacterium]|nr:hypothetical protein [Candidatus Blackburnbacteria bacterium]
MGSTLERGNIPDRAAQLEIMISREPKLAGSLQVIKGMLKKAGKSLNLPQDELWFTMLSSHQCIVGVGLSWQIFNGEKSPVAPLGTFLAEAGVMIKTEPVNIAEKELPDDAVVKIEVFCRIIDHVRRVDVYRTYGDHRLGTAYYSPEAFETDTALQQRLRDQITQELPQAIADRDKAS